MQHALGIHGAGGACGGVSLTGCSMINQDLQPPLLPDALGSPLSSLCPPSPTSPRPTWSHAETSDDANHTSDADIAHPGQGSL